MNELKYDPIRTSRNQIRLLCLPRERDVRTRILMRNYDLDQAPPFIALSYRWGRPPHEQVIWVNGRRFHVSKSLDLFLWNYAHRNGETSFQPCLIWIDQICIDQFNMNERNHQAGLIGDIFRKAVKVICWLDTREIAPESHVFDPSEDWDVILRHEYWTRLWIIQEILLAKRLRILWGTCWVEWDDLVQFCDTGNLPDNPPYNRVKWLTEKKFQWPLEELFWMGAASETSEVRDRVYGLNGVLPPGLRQSVDYQKPVRKVFEEITSMLFQSKHEPREVSMCTCLLAVAMQLLAKEIFIKDGVKGKMIKHVMQGITRLRSHYRLTDEEAVRRFKRFTAAIIGLSIERSDGGMIYTEPLNFRRAYQCLPDPITRAFTDIEPSDSNSSARAGKNEVVLRERCSGNNSVAHYEQAADRLDKTNKQIVVKKDLLEELSRGRMRSEPNITEQIRRPETSRDRSKSVPEYGCCRHHVPLQQGQCRRVQNQEDPRVEKNPTYQVCVACEKRKRERAREQNLELEILTTEIEIQQQEIFRIRAQKDKLHSQSMLKAYTFDSMPRTKHIGSPYLDKDEYIQSPAFSNRYRANSAPFTSIRLSSSLGIPIDMEVPSNMVYGRFAPWRGQYKTQVPLPTSTGTRIAAVRSSRSQSPERGMTGQACSPYRRAYFRTSSPDYGDAHSTSCCCSACLD